MHIRISDQEADVLTGRTASSAFRYTPALQAPSAYKDAFGRHCIISITQHCDLVYPDTWTPARKQESVACFVDVDAAPPATSSHVGCLNLRIRPRTCKHPHTSDITPNRLQRRPTRRLMGLLLPLPFEFSGRCLPLGIQAPPLAVPCVRSLYPGRS
ncbi:hypothetical protein OH77DRAFT_682686 [Trametes cingulata]|nr:hypothetical protein OH77DRAFT_682686 [Trametes cingulata]